MSSPDPEWNGTEAIHYEQADEVAGSAVVIGYATDWRFWNELKTELKA